MVKTVEIIFPLSNSCNSITKCKTPKLRKCFIYILSCFNAKLQFSSI